jgi:predicted nucleotidyltransferase
MLSGAESAVLASFKAALTARFGQRLERLVLFGSRARAEGHETSDLDVLVLVRGLTKEERREIIDEACARELDTGLAISPLVRDPLAVRPLGGSLAAEIARDGVPL